jgi:GMP synthase (glutamine-hydrolysing)
MILILDCGSSKTPFIESMVDEFCDFKTIPILDFEETSLTDVSGVIISGAPLLITEQNITPYLAKLKWLKTIHKPTLGICFGHLLIGITFGAFGQKMREDRDLQVIESFEDSLLLDKLPTEFEMIEDHCETISIPQHFKLVASSDACVNEVMEHETHPYYGVQFHPEVSGNYGRIIFDNFIKIALNQSSIEK